jgi:hypothetical protein
MANHEMETISIESACGLKIAERFKSCLNVFLATY